MVVPTGVDELEVVAVRDRSAIDLERRQHDLVPRTLVVVRPAAVIGADGHAASRKANHAIAVRGAAWNDVASRRVIRLAKLELKRLKDRLVVLVLVLNDQMIAVSVPEQRIRIIELDFLEALENAIANRIHARRHFAEGRQLQGCALGTRMLERIVQAGHLGELDRAVEVSGEPKLFEVRDMPDVPDDRTHQRAVLPAKIVLLEMRYEKKRPRARLFEEPRYPLFFGGEILGSRRHRQD